MPSFAASTQEFYAPYTADRAITGGAQFLLGHVLGQDVIRDDQEVIPGGHDGPFVAAMAFHTLIARLQRL
jgi:hypothetical protein